jgi:hypothetical protein
MQCPLSHLSDSSAEYGNCHSFESAISLKNQTIPFHFNNWDKQHSVSNNGQTVAQTSYYNSSTEKQRPWILIEYSECIQVDHIIQNHNLSKQNYFVGWHGITSLNSPPEAVDANRPPVLRSVSHCIASQVIVVTSRRTVNSKTGFLCVFEKNSEMVALVSDDGPK